MSDYTNPEFNQGYQAFRLGYDIDDNPYELGDESYYDWRDGYQEAEENQE